MSHSNGYTAHQNNVTSHKWLPCSAPCPIWNSTACLGHSVKHSEAESWVIYGYIFVNVYIKEQVVRFVLDLSLMMIINLCLAHPGPRLNPVLE